MARVTASTELMVLEPRLSTSDLLNLSSRKRSMRSLEAAMGIGEATMASDARPRAMDKAVGTP